MGDLSQVQHILNFIDYGMSDLEFMQMICIMFLLVWGVRE